MKITTEKSLSSFAFWGQASDNANKLTKEDLDRLESILESLYIEGMEERQLNDMMANEFDTIIDWLELKSEVRIKVKNIDWDIDEYEDEEKPLLPTQFEFEIELPFEYSDDDLEDAMNDYIDEKFGFCYSSIDYELEEL